MTTNDKEELEGCEYCGLKENCVNYKKGWEDCNAQNKEKLDYTLNNLVGLNKVDAEGFVLAIKNSQKSFELGYEKGKLDERKEIIELIEKLDSPKWALVKKLKEKLE